MMYQGEAPSACAARTNSFSLEGLHLRADQQADVHPAEQRGDEDDGEEAAAGQRAEQQRGEQRGHHREELDDAHDDPVGPALEIAGERAERDADEDAEGRGGEADGQRDARAVDDAGEEVAAEVVDAEPELRTTGRPAPASGTSAAIGSVLVMSGAKIAARMRIGQHDAADDRRLVGEEPAPGEIERAPLPVGGRRPVSATVSISARHCRWPPTRMRGLSMA